MADAARKRGDEVDLHCSDCGRGLMKILVVNEEVDFLARYKARCPYCGDASFAEEIQGVVAPAGYHVPKPDDETDCVPLTELTGESECRGDTFVFEVRAL